MPRKTDSPSTEKELLASIHDALTNLLTVAALGYTEGKNQQDAIQKFAAAGLSAKTISEMTGWPTTTVAPIISRTKVKSKAPPQKGPPRTNKAMSDGNKS